MNRYSSYKDSGNEWIGEIPSGWECIRLGMLGTFSSSGIDKKLKDNEVPVRMVNYTDLIQRRKYHPIQTGEKEYMKVTTPQSKLKEHRLEKGDMVFIPSSETFEDLGYSSLIDFDEEDIVYSYHILRYKTIKPIHHYYKKYLINHHSVLNQFSSECKGTTRQIIGRNVFNNVRVVLPTIKEQEQIVSFLDDKTQKIDTLIQQKEKKIKLLKENRTSLINHVVTKGIDTNMEMKDSGVEWVGEIPKDWDIIPLRYLGSFQNGISKGSEFFGKGYPFMSYGDVYKYDVTPIEVDGKVESDDVERERYSVISGDVFFTRTSETKDDIGVSSTCLKTIDNCSFSGFVIRYRFHKETHLPEFSRYHFQTHWKKVLIESKMNIVTRSSLSQRVLGMVPVLVPSIKQQQQIVEYLDKQTEEIDTLIQLEQKKIDTLKEYRQSLISEVVTGKIRVCKDDHSMNLESQII
jgi:type I restriction enzyme S subunit